MTCIDYVHKTAEIPHLFLCFDNIPENIDIFLSSCQGQKKFEDQNNLIQKTPFLLFRTAKQCTLKIITGRTLIDP